MVKERVQRKKGNRKQEKGGFWDRNTYSTDMFLLGAKILQCFNGLVCADVNFKKIFKFHVTF